MVMVALQTRAIKKHLIKRIRRGGGGVSAITMVIEIVIIPPLLLIQTVGRGMEMVRIWLARLVMVLEVKIIVMVVHLVVMWVIMGGWTRHRSRGNIINLVQWEGRDGGVDLGVLIGLEEVEIEVEGDMMMLIIMRSKGGVGIGKEVGAGVEVVVGKELGVNLEVWKGLGDEEIDIVTEAGKEVEEAGAEAEAMIKKNGFAA